MVIRNVDPAGEGDGATHAERRVQDKTRQNSRRRWDGRLRFRLSYVVGGLRRSLVPGMFLSPPSNRGAASSQWSGPVFMNRTEIEHYFCLGREGGEGETNVKRSLLLS